MFEQQTIDIDLDRNLGDIDDLDIKNKPNPITNLWLYLPAAIVLLVVESILTHALYNGLIGLSFGLILHILVMAVCIGWIWVRSLLGQNINIPVFALIIISLTGPMGALTILIIIFAMSLTKRASTPFSEWYYSLFPDADESDVDALYDRLYHGLDDFSDKTNVVSFQDVIKLGTYRQKQEVISKIVNHYNPDFAETLQVAINDPQNAVRVQAATAISKVLDNYANLYDKLIEARQKYPKNHKVLVNLARHTYYYALCGLLDEQRTQMLLEESQEYFKEYLDLYPNDTSALYHQGSILLKQKKYNFALDSMIQCFQNIESENIAPGMLETYLNALFKLGKYDEIKSAVITWLPRLNPSDKKTLEVSEALSVWTTGVSHETLYMRPENV